MVRPRALGQQTAARLSPLAAAKQGVALGYRRARSHDLIDVAACPVLTPRISDSLPKLKAALAPLLGGKREARVERNRDFEWASTLSLEGARPSPAFARGALPGRLRAIGAARLTADGDSLVLAGTPEVDLSGARAKLPPGAFLQASHDARGRTGGARAGRSWDRQECRRSVRQGSAPSRSLLARSSAVAAYVGRRGRCSPRSAEAVRRTPKLKPIKTRSATPIPLSARAQGAARPPTRWCSTHRGQAPRRRPRRCPSLACGTRVAVSCIPLHARPVTSASWSMAATASPVSHRLTSSCSHRTSRSSRI